jgi:NADPH-dependent 2,4-dienoyl-CoA reductase/sulfur reductase-like enzyme
LLTIYKERVVREVVIVGASLAGTRTAEALRRAGYDGTLTLVGREPHPPYDRPPLTKAALARGPELASLQLPSTVDLDARWIRGHSATDLDLTGRHLRLDTGERLRFDGLVIATGASPRRLRPSGVGPLVHHIRTFEDCVQLHHALAAPGQEVLVIGAGLLGSEIASVAVAGGHRVTLVEAAEGPMLGALGPEISAYCARLHRARGVELRTSTVVLSLSPETWRGKKAIAVLEDRSTGDRWATRADVVVAALGTAAQTGWLRSSGLDSDGGVRTDASLTALGRDGVPIAGVVAVGDVARAPQPLVGGIARRVEHWTAAAGHAEIAAATLLGSRAAVSAPVPSFGTEQHGFEIRAVGLPGVGDATTVVDGTPEDHRFVAKRTLRGRLVGAVAVNHTAGLTPYRAELERHTARTPEATPGGK